MSLKERFAILCQADETILNKTSSEPTTTKPQTYRLSAETKEWLASLGFQKSDYFDEHHGVKTMPPLTDNELAILNRLMPNWYNNVGGIKDETGRPVQMGDCYSVKLQLGVLAMVYEGDKELTCTADVGKNEARFKFDGDGELRWSIIIRTDAVEPRLTQINKKKGRII